MFRIPAGYNKLFGFRPSGHRIPCKCPTRHRSDAVDAGAPNSQEGQEATASVLGPLSPSVGGLKLFFKSVLDAKPWNADPLALRMPWNESMYQLEEHGSGKEPLCFALMWENGQVRPDPPYWRAMEMTKKALLAAGHKGKSTQCDEVSCHSHRLDLARSSRGQRSLRTQSTLTELTA